MAAKRSKKPTGQLELSSGRGPTLYLIDAPGWIFRAYHALPPLSNARGMQTGAIFGFSNMLLKLLEEHRPDYVAAVFDAGPRTFRNELYADYKAHRPPTPEDLVPQIPWVDRVVAGLRIPALRLEGYEADDIIATLAARARGAGLEVVIVSSDKDLMQLAGDGVMLLDTMKNIAWRPPQITERYGVTPAQLGDWLALTGDSVDNVPGVPGVGPKTATKLLSEFGDLETVLGSADKVKGPKLSENLRVYAEQARLSRRLVELARDCPIQVPLEELRRAEPDGPALWEVFGELGFQRLQQRFAPASKLDRSLYRTILAADELRGVLAEVRAAGRCAVDLETTSLNAVSAQIVGVSLCWGPGKACYIPVSHVYLGMPKQLRLATVLEALEPLLVDASFPKLGQNHKYDWIVLKRAGVDMRGVVCDPMLASYVLDPSRNSHGLDELALEHLRHPMIRYKEVTGASRSFESVEVPRATEYAAEDAEATLLLADLLGEKVGEDPELARLLEEVELPLSRILAEMELRGVALDCDRLRALRPALQAQLEEIQTRVQREAGWDVNINSPKQLQKLLFEDLGLSTGRKTKTGDYSTDADVLADLAVEHPIAAEIEEYRTLSKLIGTYIDALPALVNPETGRVHTSYNQAVAATGRLSSSDPNLQNIPVRNELGRKIREAFTAPPGRVLVSADYSQVELRVLAHLSQDPTLLDAFHEGQDVHLRTAAEVFGLPPESVSADQRRVAKAVNFGVIYGQTDWGLSRQLRIAKNVAASYIESYFARYAGVRRFMDETIAAARESGVVRTLLGRKRPVPEINAKRYGVRMYAERIVRNTPIQGTAADLMKLAMLRVDAELRRARLDAPMILTVHDELVFEARPGDVEQVSALARETMAAVLKLDVPLKVDVGVGATWTEAHG
jgi:DNA polymerase-1